MAKTRFELVQSPAALEAAAQELAGAPRLFVDTEFESTRDGTTLCLLQISRGDTIFLIDPLRLPALDALSPVLAATDTEWVLHAGQQDVALLVGKFGLRGRPRVFDTQVAWALLGPEYSVSLAYLQYRLFGVRVGKAHQADDWKRRPLPASQLAYAASDIERLPDIRRILGERSAALGRDDIVVAASGETVWPEPEPALPLSLESFRNAWQLDRRNQAALRVLIEWFNDLDMAARRHAPESKTLLAIAGRLPESVADLARIKGVSRGFCQEHGGRLVSRLQHAADHASASEFAVIEPPAYATFHEIRMDGWLALARAEICAKLEVAPELALPSRVLRPLKAALLAGGNVEAAAAYLSGWRGRLLASALFDFAAANPVPAR